MRVYDCAQKTVKWDYHKSESFITTIAFLCGEPAWERCENGVVMGLYNLGGEAFWIEKSKIEERKKKPFPCEASITEVAKCVANRLVIDEKNNEVLFRYLLEDGRIAEFSSKAVLEERGRLFCGRNDNLKKRLKEDEEHEI